jgi:hypothetical protein
MKEFTLSKAAMVRLFGINPNPDDPGEPRGPGAPVVRGNTVLDRIAWVLLNPQPLPPKVAAARLARTVINEAVREAQILEAAGRSEQTGKSGQNQIARFVDEYCGTPPHPRPPYWLTGIATPEELLTAAAQFQMAADGLEKGAMQTACAAAADKLFETGVTRLEAPQAKAAAR